MITMSGSSRLLGTALALWVISGCGSTYTILDRSSIQVSPNSEAVAQTVLPQTVRTPQLVQLLAQADAVYQLQLNNLQERRNKVRARKRDLQFAAYGLMSGAALGVGGLAIGASTGAENSTGALLGAGAVSLLGLGVGTLLQVSAAIQEEPSVTDDKARVLQRSYESMLERVRNLASQPGSTVPEVQQTQSQIALLVEYFISEARQVKVKG